MDKNQTPCGGAAVREEAAALRQAADAHGVPFEAVAGLVAAARQEARHRRRRVPAGDLERRIDEIVAAAAASWSTGPPA